MKAPSLSLGSCSVCRSRPDVHVALAPSRGRVVGAFGWVRNVVDPHPRQVGGRELGAPLYPERAPALAVAGPSRGGFPARRARRCFRPPRPLRSGRPVAPRALSDRCFLDDSPLSFRSGGVLRTPVAQSGFGEGAASAGGVLQLLQCRIP